MTREGRYGSEICPWVINVQPGQRINITLFDFSVPIKYRNPNEINDVLHTTRCHKYAVITESGVTGRRPVCSTHRREKHVYTSEGHMVEIQMMDFKTEQTLPYYLLKYQGEATLL